MASKYGVNALKILSNVPSEKAGVGENPGGLICFYDTYALGATVFATTDTLYLMKLPAGFRVMDVIIKTDDLGTTGVLDVGWQASSDAVEAADADGFAASLDVKTAAVSYSMAVDGAVNFAGLFKKFSSPVQVVMTASEATNQASGSFSIAIWGMIY